MSKVLSDYKEIYPAFSYQQLAQTLKTAFFDEIKDSGYSAFLGGDAGSQDFYMINSLSPSKLYKSHQYRKENLQYLQTLPFQSRYKLQVHIALSEKKNKLGYYYERAQAWNIIKDILIKHNVREFKIIGSDLAMSEVSYQVGKDVTINLFADPKEIKEWNSILNEINQTLIEYKVPLPSQGAKSSQQRGEEYTIQKIPYMTYRYEFGKPTDDLVKKLIFIPPPISELTIADFTADFISSSQSSSSFISSDSSSLLGSTQLTLHVDPSIESKIDVTATSVEQKQVLIHETPTIGQIQRSPVNVHTKSSVLIPVTPSVPSGQETKKNTGVTTVYIPTATPNSRLFQTTTSSSNVSSRQATVQPSITLPIQSSQSSATLLSTTRKSIPRKNKSSDSEVKSCCILM